MAKNQKVYIFSCSPETGELIESMSKHVEGGTEAIFQKGILLMGVALKAQKLGNRIAIVDKDDKVIDTIEGL
jgi:hypothetical protein